VTKGVQYHVTSPDRALVQGLFRVARRENVNSKLTTLDVECSSSAATAWAIEQVLGTLSSKGQRRDLQGETEYVERGSLLQVHKVVPDAAVNAFKRAERDGADMVERSLHGTRDSDHGGAAVQLRADRLGTLQSLVWCETSAGEVPVEEGHVEVEVMASGVNFKDVATIMGLVPEDESKLGCECAGIVTRVGSASKFSVGDRVCLLAQGSYANRLQIPVDRAHAIPSSMSFQNAATIPLVFLTSIYALFHMANLSQGQVSTGLVFSYSILVLSYSILVPSYSIRVLSYPIPFQPNRFLVSPHPLGRQRHRHRHRLHPACAVQEGRGESRATPVHSPVPSAH
jgi:hypothetical protein